ncbi:hypothetical protein HMPREF3198_00177 [Winkia neuii]|nr:hypothetical protein HMPREF3198_00177 [Winkia neuii]
MASIGVNSRWCFEGGNAVLSRTDQLAKRPVKCAYDDCSAKLTKIACKKVIGYDRICLFATG